MALRAGCGTLPEKHDHATAEVMTASMQVDESGFIRCEVMLRLYNP